MALPLALLLLAPLAAASETVVVVSDEQAVYAEALAAFKAAYGGDFDVQKAGDSSLPGDARVVVAIGGRAAARAYPPTVALIHCLAPGLGRSGHRGPTAEVSMLPSPAHLVDGLRRADGKLASVGVLWSGSGFSDYVAQLARAGGEKGVKVVSRRVRDTGDMLDALRELKGAVEALWLPPDPAFASPDRLKALDAATKEWSLPYYGSTPGFLRFGAKATVGAGFGDAGRAASRAAHDALAGRLERRYYSEQEGS